MRHSRRRTLVLLAAAFLCLLPLRAKAQDALPCYAAADRPAEADDTLRCLGVAGDTVPLLPLRFPAAFRQTGDNRIADSCGVPVSAGPVEAVASAAAVAALEAFPAADEAAGGALAPALAVRRRGAALARTTPAPVRTLSMSSRLTRRPPPRAPVEA